MNTEITAATLLEKLVQKIETNDVKDSVHKIKLMTCILSGIPPLFG